MDLQFLVRLGLFHVLRNRARVYPIPVVAKAARARLEDISAPAAGEALGTHELRNGLLLDWPNSGPQHVLASYVQEPSRMVPVCVVCVSVLSVCVCYICVVCVVLSKCLCVCTRLSCSSSLHLPPLHTRLRKVPGLDRVTCDDNHRVRVWDPHVPNVAV